MTTGDYIPNGRGAFDDWQDNLVTQANSFIPTWGLPTAATAEWTLLTNTPGKKKKRWEAAWAIVKTKVFTRPQEEELIEARKDYESGHRDDPNDTSLRLFIARYIRNNPRVTGPQKLAMGLPVPDEVISPSTDTQSKSPGSELSGKVRQGEHLIQHSDVLIEGQISKALPEGVKCIQIFIAYTEAAVTVAPPKSAFVYDGEVKRGKYNRVFDEAQEGKRAWYYARMLFSGKIPTYGPPSPVWNAVIM